MEHNVLKSVLVWHCIDIFSCIWPHEIFFQCCSQSECFIAKIFWIHHHFAHFVDKASFRWFKSRMPVKKMMAILHLELQILALKTWWKQEYRQSSADNTVFLSLVHLVCTQSLLRLHGFLLTRFFSNVSKNSVSRGPPLYENISTHCLWWGTERWNYRNFLFYIFFWNHTEA